MDVKEHLSLHLLLIVGLHAGILHVSDGGSDCKKKKSTMMLNITQAVINADSDSTLIVLKSTIQISSVFFFILSQYNACLIVLQYIELLL